MKNNNTELQKKYKSEIVNQLQKAMNADNIMSVPKLLKITLNSGLGEAKTNPDVIDQMITDIGLITGQQPVVTKAKLAISNFKIRQGMPIGVKVTLRGHNMWYFLEKLINIVIPRIKDFRGLSTKSFDGNGNYALGLKDHTIFPEIDPNKVTRIKPLQIIINTNAGVDKDALNLLKSLGLPFKK